MKKTVLLFVCVVFLSGVNARAQNKGIGKDEINKIVYQGIVNLRSGNIIGDNSYKWGMFYTKSTNIGLDLISTLIAERKGVISKKEADMHILAVLEIVDTLRTYKGLFPEFIKIEEDVYAEVKDGIIRYSAVDSAWLTFAIAIVKECCKKNKEIAALAEKILDGQDYSFLVASNGMMKAGLQVEERTNRIVTEYDFCYDNINSELRPVVLGLIGLKKLPASVWDAMWYKKAFFEGLIMAEGWSMSSFVEFTGNIFFDEMLLSPEVMGLSHTNYIKAVKQLAEKEKYSIYGFAPCSHKPEGYTEFGLQKSDIVSPYAAALLTTSDDPQVWDNFLKIFSLLPQNGTPLPDALLSSTGEITNKVSLSLDQNLLFLSINKEEVRKLVREMPWYKDAVRLIEQFNNKYKGIFKN